MATRARNPDLTDPLDEQVEATHQTRRTRNQTSNELTQPLFALSPATVNDNIINFASSEGAKLYKAATTPLPLKIECKPSTLKPFLAMLAIRVRTCGWDNLLRIPINPLHPNGPTKHLLHDYGHISLAYLREYVETYAQQQTRKNQDTDMLYVCLYNSLSETALAKIALYQEEYHTHTTIPSGVLLLKIIIRESHNDTNATTTFIRQRLSSLDTYIKTIDSDIGKFNQYVQDQLQSLHARGQDTYDLLSNLFKGYKAASDRDFVAYIRHKENEYNEGKDITPQYLMQLAVNRYYTMKEGGTWNSPTEEQTEIIALKAQLKKLQKVTKTRENTKGANNNQSRRHPIWKTKQPKTNEPTTKKVKGKIYHWCPTHKLWTIHDPKECKGIAKREKEEKETEEKKEEDATTETKKNKTNKLVQAMATICSDEE